LVDTGGSVQERYTYDPYGRVEVRDAGWGLRAGGSAYAWAYQFQGLRRESAAEYDDARRRVYSPPLMRFISTDPIGFAAGDPNLSRFVGNGPVNYTDPLGLESVGHHWVPRNVVLDFWSVLSEDAKSIHAGYYSGPMGGHNRGPLGGVSHSPEYDGAVREELEYFIRKNRINPNNPMTGEQMREFAKNMKEGTTYTGKTANAKTLTTFNTEVLRRAKACGTKPPAADLKSLIERGRNYRKNSGRYLAGAAIGGILSLLSAGSAMAGQLNKLTASPQFAQALQAAEAGDLATVQRLLVGFGGVDAYNDRNHLFGRFAAEMEAADPKMSALLMRLHGSLLEYFANLRRTKVTPDCGTGK
jgi:RHS repeat-associated protein